MNRFFAGSVKIQHIVNTCKHKQMTKRQNYRSVYESYSMTLVNYEWLESFHDEICIIIDLLSNLLFTVLSQETPLFPGNPSFPRKIPVQEIALGPYIVLRTYVKSHIFRKT